MKSKKNNGAESIPKSSLISSSPNAEGIPVYPVPKSTQIQEAQREYDYYKAKFDSCRFAINRLIKDEEVCKIQVAKWKERLEKMGVQL